MRKLAIFLIMIMIAFSISACSSKPEAGSESKPAAGQKYTFGVDATYPPFEFEKDGKYVGIDIDLLNAIAKAEGFEVEIKPMNFKGIIPAITAKQLDGGIAGISITDERKKVVDFSEPYYEAGLSLVVREDNTTITKPEDLKGKKIAIKKGTTGAKFADELAKKYGATVTYFDSSPAMFQEVVNGNADVTIEDYPVISYKLAIDKDAKLKIVGDRLNGDWYGIAVGKGNEELLKKINDGFKKVKDSGEYDKIMNTYMKSDKK